MLGLSLVNAANKFVPSFPKLSKAFTVKNELIVAEICSIFFPQFTKPELVIEKTEAYVCEKFVELCIKVAAKTMETFV